MQACTAGKGLEFKSPSMEVQREIIHSIAADTRGLPGPVTKAIFLNRGELISASCYTGELLVWKLEGAAYSRKFEKRLFEGSINAISHLWLETSFRVFCACSDGNLRIVEFDTRFGTVETQIFCHRSGISSVSNSDRYLMTGSMDHTTAIFDVQSMKEVRRNTDHRGIVRDVGVCSVGEFDISCFASCSDDGTVIIYNKDGDEFKRQVIEIGQPVYSLAWSKTGYSLSVGYGESSVRHFVPDISGLFKDVELKRAE
ncbi:UNVERIFIED_CONTAM: hypothetical protein PYX00_011355 [Menopon gallinae]|uniref:Protein SEC13 homolog n=1 Tax=Menopon gallinae TaxID=328185 RepID=A0AAW2H7F9_9NEOP